MTIEIRQMLIKSNVFNDHAPEHQSSSSRKEMETIKEEILSECKQLIIEYFREIRER